MTEHIYNELIRTYAGACSLDHVKETHIDMYISDAWELFHSMEKDGGDINGNILNSMVFLYANALRPDDLEANVLPLFDKYKLKHDVYTYQHLTRLYLNIRDIDAVFKLYDRLVTKESFKPNTMLL